MAKFAALGLGHGHVFEVFEQLFEAGFSCSGYDDASSDEYVLGRFRAVHPDISCTERERLLDDPAISLIYIAAQPKDRCELALAALDCGKHVLLDKPAVISLEELDRLERASRRTGLNVMVCFNERLCVRSAVAASRLVKSGAIGKVVHMTGMGPHRLDRARRPQWFFEPEAFGRILVNIASHQVDQFLHFTGSRSAEVVGSTVGNINTPENPGFDDFGEIHLRSADATGYMRVDWYTPRGLPTWGDGRTFILGTDGYIELRKFVDIAGRPNGEHLYIVDHDSTRHVDCSAEPLDFFHRLKADVLDGSCLAMPQEHVFEVSRLTIQAQLKAHRLGAKDAK